MSLRLGMKIIAALLGVAITPLPGFAQASAPDPLIRELQDSIGKLLRKTASQDSALQKLAAEHPLPEFVDIRSGVFGDRANFTVELNGPGALRAILFRDNGAPIDTVTRTEYARVHNFAFERLSSPGRYYVEVRLLGLNGDPSDRFRTGKQGGNNHPRLAFTTSTPSSPPTPIVSAPVVKGTTVEITVQTPVNALIQGRLHRSIGGTPVLSDTAATQGAALITDPVTGAASPTPTKSTATLRFTQLDSLTQYYYVIEAMDASGRRATMPGGLGSFTTGTNPAEFGFSGPINIRINPATGLIFQWNSTTPADSGRVRLVGASGGAWRTATVKQPDGKTLTAEVPATLPGDTTTTPTIEVEMFGKGGGPGRRLQLTIGLQQPTQTQVASVPAAARSAVNDLATAIGGGDTKVKWKEVLTTGAGVLLKVLPALVP